MYKHLAVLLRFFVFWLTVFSLDRLVFVIYFREKLHFNQFSEFLAPFYHGLRLDLSMAAYFSLLPLIFYLIKWFYPKFPANAFLTKV